jgi:hypothetical protein
MLSSGSRDLLCNSPAALLCSWVFTVLVYWGLVSLPHPLSLGQVQWSVSQPPAVSMLWWFADCFSILQCCLTLDVAHWLRRWAFWTTTCPISGSSLSLAHCWPFCLSILCFLKVHAGIGSLPLSPSLEHAFNVPSPLLCVSFQLLVYCSIFFLWGFSLPMGLCWFIPGVAGGNTTWFLVLNCLVCLKSPQQVWSWHLAAVWALLFSQCNVVWRSFLWARGPGCRSFDSPWCFIFSKCVSSISARFLIHGAHAVCFCSLVSILSHYCPFLKWTFVD